MFELLGVLFSVAVPGAIAYGSSSRRRLSVIREEIEAYNEAPARSVAKKVLYAQLNRSTEEYQAHRAQSGRIKLVIWVGALLSIVYLAGAAAFLLITDSPLVKSLVSDEETRSTAGAVATVIALVAGVTLAFTMTIVTSNQSRRLRLLEEKRTGSKSPAKPRKAATRPTRPPQVKRIAFDTDEAYQEVVAANEKRWGSASTSDLEETNAPE